MPNSWTAALAAYRYPVTRPFTHASRCPRWIQPRLPVGDRAETISFERYFRATGQAEITPWAEVVFWKMASQGGRADRVTAVVLDWWSSAEPSILWGALTAYTYQPTKERFDHFRRLFGFTTRVIAIVATFPAFVEPDRFPMIDTRIVKWVRNNAVQQNAADPHGPQLMARSHERVLMMADFVFMQRWNEWCCHTAEKLTMSTGEPWRSRDVEMAIFQAQGGSLALNPLPLTKTAILAV
jgi:hypothetical protein